MFCLPSSFREDDGPGTETPVPVVGSSAPAIPLPPYPLRPLRRAVLSEPLRQVVPHPRLPLVYLLTYRTGGPGRPAGPWRPVHALSSSAEASWHPRLPLGLVWDEASPPVLWRLAREEEVASTVVDDLPGLRQAPTWHPRLPLALLVSSSEETALLLHVRTGRRVSLPLLTGDNLYQPSRYGRPVWHPHQPWVALPATHLHEGPGVLVARFPDGKPQWVPLPDDPRRCLWHPYRLRLYILTARSDLWVWDLETNEHRHLARLGDVFADVARAVWLHEGRRLLVVPSLGTSGSVPYLVDPASGHVETPAPFRERPPWRRQVDTLFPHPDRPGWFLLGSPSLWVPETGPLHRLPSLPTIRRPGSIWPRLDVGQALTVYTEPDGHTCIVRFSLFRPGNRMRLDVSQPPVLTAFSRHGWLLMGPDGRLLHLPKNQGEPQEMRLEASLQGASVVGPWLLTWKDRELTLWGDTPP